MCPVLMCRVYSYIKTCETTNTQGVYSNRRSHVAVPTMYCTNLCTTTVVYLYGTTVVKLQLYTVDSSDTDTSETPAIS